MRLKQSPIILLTTAILLFAQVPAQAENSWEPISGKLTGYVSDLGRQQITFKGNGGQALVISDVTGVTTTTLTLAAIAEVVDSAVTGRGNLSFSGTLGNGTSVVVNMTYTITEGYGLNLPCSSLPAGSPCDTADIIPLVYSGYGVVMVSIGSRIFQYNVIVVIDASNHPQVLGGTYRVTGFDPNNQPIIDFTLKVSRYLVYYTNTVALAQASGDTAGGVVFIVKSYEDHTALPSGISSTESGDVKFRVVYKGYTIAMNGKFGGSSTGWPLYPYVMSQGTFKTGDGSTLHGSYTTTWDTPFTFTSQFIGQINVHP